MRDLICLGEPLVEFVELSPEGGSAGLYRRGFGGDVSNVAIAAARQGATAAICTKLGDDGFGHALLALWDAEAVDHTQVSLIPGQATGVYFVDYGPDGHRFSYLRAGSAASLMTPAWLADIDLTSAGILHVSGISQAISSGASDTVRTAIARMRAAGRIVSYDTNLRLALWSLPRAREVILGTIGQCQIALPGLEDARLLTGLEAPDAIVDQFLALGCDTVALTLGAAGVLVATATDRLHIDAAPVKVVDATGAGDCFDGAFLARIAAGDTVFDAARYAAVAASLSTMATGALNAIPTRDQVLRYMKG